MSTENRTPDWARVLPLARGAHVAAAGAQGLLALDKPAGVLTHPNDAGDQAKSLLNARYDHEQECYRWTPAGPDDPGILYLINRLDSPTSGLVLTAVTIEAAAAGRRAFAEGRAHKIYFALALGRPRPPRGQWNDRLARAKPGGPLAGRGVRVKVGLAADSQTAETVYQCLESSAAGGGMELSLLRLEPLTGRTHQLRVQCATHHHPIIGDATYGDFEFNRTFAKRTGLKRLFLHAAGLKIPSLKFAAESPVPEEFYTATRPGR